MEAPTDVRLRLRWETADGAAAVTRLGRSGFVISAAGVLSLASLVVQIAPGASGPDRLVQVDAAIAIQPSVPAAPQPNGIVDLAAVGIATVDADRFLSDGGYLDVDVLPDDRHLGAFARRAVDHGVTVLVLEPNTEGPLVATLVRHGEGIAAVYFRAGSGGLGAVAQAVHAAGGGTSPVRDGPLGPSIVLVGGNVAGPHLIVVGTRPLLAANEVRRVPSRA